MKRPFCNLSAKDYGLKETPDSFKVAKEINATIVDVIETERMKYEDKWRAVYNVLKKHKKINADNQKAIDAIEAIFFLNGVGPMTSKQKPEENRIIIRDSERKTKDNDSALFAASVAGAITICAATIVGASIDQIAMATGLVMLVVGWGSWVG